MTENQHLATPSARKIPSSKPFLVEKILQESHDPSHSDSRLTSKNQ